MTQDDVQGYNGWGMSESIGEIIGLCDLPPAPMPRVDMNDPTADRGWGRG